MGTRTIEEANVYNFGELLITAMKGEVVPSIVEKGFSKLNFMNRPDLAANMMQSPDYRVNSNRNILATHVQALHFNRLD